MTYILFEADIHSQNISVTISHKLKFWCLDTDTHSVKNEIENIIGKVYIIIDIDIL